MQFDVGMRQGRRQVFSGCSSSRSRLTMAVDKIDDAMCSEVGGLARRQFRWVLGILRARWNWRNGRRFDSGSRQSVDCFEPCTTVDGQDEPACGGAPGSSSHQVEGKVV